MLKQIVVVCSFVAACYAAACSQQQLNGTFSSFRYTGTFGTYQAGTKQVVSYNWPGKSNVSKIIDLDIVKSGVVTNLSIESGIPTTFTTTSSSDVAGAIVFTLPSDLSAGSHVYRLTLVVNGGQTCTLDSSLFTIFAAPKECTPGTSICVNSDTFRECNSTGKYQPASNCTGGTICQQVDNQHICSLQSGGGGGSDLCTWGTIRCSGIRTFQHCIPQTDGTYRWGDNLSCGDGTICENQTGGYIQCVLDSGNSSCTEGEERCTVDGDVESCVSGKWQITEACTGGTVCKKSGISAQCSLSSGGTGGDSCTPGYMKCVTNSTFQTCSPVATGWEWGVEQSCGSGTFCKVHLDNYIICG